MKRTPLKRSTRRRKLEPGELAWKTHPAGGCAVCGNYGPLVRHHILLAQIVRRAGGDVWDLRNGLLVGDPWTCSCHARHHAGGDGRIPFSKVPSVAVAFAVETVGEGPAAEYFERRYFAARDSLPVEPLSPASGSTSQAVPQSAPEGLFPASEFRPGHWENAA